MSGHLTKWAVIVMIVTGIGSGGCGSDDAEEPAKGGTDSGGSGRAAGGGGSGSAEKAIMCGTLECQPPEPAGDLTACCLDPFTSTCGTARAGGPCGMAQASGDPRCPSVDIMGGAILPSCCNQEGKCGIDATMFGSMGCVELSAAAEMAKSMGGGSLTWPAPRSCEQ